MTHTEHWKTLRLLIVFASAILLAWLGMRFFERGVSPP